MRSLFGAPREALLLAVLALALGVALVLAVAALRNPLLPRLAWRNVPRRPGFAALVTLGLTLGTVILSSAYTTGDTMRHAVRTVVAGVLGAADEVVFIPAPAQRSGFDLAQAIASGTLLTGVTVPFAEGEVERVRAALAGDPRVAAILPVLHEQAAVAAEGRGFSARLNLVGAPLDLPPGFGALYAESDGAPLPLDALAADEVYVNREAAAALGVRAGDALRVFGLAGGEVTLRTRAVARLGDLGGGQAALFLPLPRLQTLAGRPGQVNQVLVVNRGGPEERLRASWPLTVALRAAFLDDAAAERLFRALSAPAARQALARAAEAPGPPGRGAERLRDLLAALDAPGPTPAFEALVQDPEVLGRVAARLPPGVVRNPNRGPLAATVDGATFRVLDVQGLAQDQADVWGSAFTDLFVVLGLFSLFSGVLLIVLVFALLALERRSELGITRALGGRRRDVVLLLALEGGIYSAVSALFGLGGGIALAFAILALAGDLVAQYGFRLEPVVEPDSLLACYLAGVVLTFATVTATAWRSSRFSIVSAIRDLPDPPSRPGARALLLAAAPLLVGAGLLWLGLGRTLSLAYATGVALSIVGLALLARWGLRRVGARGPERVVFTAAGAVLVGWWLVPPPVLRAVGLPVFPPVVEMGFLGGIAMLLGAVWLIAYNVGLLHRVRGRAALWRLSTAYVAANRFRVGMTLAMFGLVTLSLTLAAVLLTATHVAFADPRAVTGGWHIRAESDRPPRDLRADLDASGVLPPGTFAAVGAASPLRVEVLQPIAPAARWRPATLTVVDEGFLRRAAPADLTGWDAGTGEPAAWTALAARPGRAVVGAALLVGQAEGGPRVLAEDGPSFRPFRLWLRDTRATRPAIPLDVVGVADARGPFGSSILTSAASLGTWPPPERATYVLAVPDGANARDLAAGLALAAADLRAATLGDEMRLVAGVRGLLGAILQGFMGVGMLAGVAALGTLATRAVVERRRQIGVLRALGFSARHVALGLLLESGLVALLGAGLGAAVGLHVARGTLELLARQTPELRYGVPWDQVGLIVLLALGASLAMTLLPAHQASRLSPAEALREV